METITNRLDAKSEIADTGVRGPRRAAMQWLAGLAGLGAAALASGSAVGQGQRGIKDKAKKKGKKGGGNNSNNTNNVGAVPSGALVNIQVVGGSSGPIESGSVGQAYVRCPAPNNNNQQVFVLGGGFAALNQDLRLLTAIPLPVVNKGPNVAWEVEAKNVGQNVSEPFVAQAICGYFKK